MKIGWKIRKLWIWVLSFDTLNQTWSFANFHKSQNISWPVDMNMQMSELMSLPHYLPYILYIKFWKIQYFAHTCEYACPSYQAVLELTLFYMYSEWNWGKSNKKSNILIAEIWNICHFCAQNEWEIVRRWHHQLAHLHIIYSYQLVKKCFLKICETSKCHYNSYFQPIFIRFSLFYSQIFTLSYEIKLNLFRISPLSGPWIFF